MIVVGNAAKQGYRMLKTFNATRYVTPLREGGSLPAIVEVDDGSLFVMKFMGAGQGVKALIAELLAGEIGRLLGLNVPELAFIELDPTVGRAEPNPEIQDILRGSIGLNLGLRYLPQAHIFNLLLAPPPDEALASAIVWFDAYVTNVDRTARNVNMLIWQDDLWLIDHGASLYFHHNWANYMERSRNAFTLIKEHTLLSLAGQLAAADAAARRQLTAEALGRIIDVIPAAWLTGEPQFAGPGEYRAAYLAYLLERLAGSAIFVEEANRARQGLL
jgi:hypothetical protein